MPNKQSSFAERCAQMHDVAEQLTAIAEIVTEEAIRMAAAVEALCRPPRWQRAKASPLEPPDYWSVPLALIVPCLLPTTSSR